MFKSYSPCGMVIIGYSFNPHLYDLVFSANIIHSLELLLQIFYPVAFNFPINNLKKQYFNPQRAGYKHKDATSFAE